MNTLKHLAIIMDGNGRWAELQNKQRVKGHEAGAKTVKEITMFCVQNPDIQRLTPVSYTPLTLPTIISVYKLVLAVLCI